MTATTWVTVAEASQLLGLSVSKVRNMAKAAQLPAFRFGTSYKFDRAEVERWIREQRIKPGGEA
jgi:excisionase family DNA binding protein